MLWGNQMKLKAIKKIKYRLLPSSKMKDIKSSFHHIGKNCLICTNNIDQPCLVSLGNNVILAADSVLLNHDYSVQIIRSYYNDAKLDKVGPIIIGNNVFVGARSIILPNCKVEDNTIISAGSLLTGKCYEGGYVWGGIPAKPLMTIEDYYDKTKAESLKLPWIDKLQEYNIDELNSIREKYYFKDNV